MFIEAIMTAIVVPIWVISSIVFYKFGKSKTFAVSALLFSIVPISSAIAYTLHMSNGSGFIIILCLLIGLSADVVGGLLILDNIYGQLGFQHKREHDIIVVTIFPFFMWLPFILLLIIGTFPPLSTPILEGFLSGILVPVFLLIMTNSWILSRKRAKGARFWIVLLIWAIFAVFTIISSILTDIFIIYLEVKQFEFIKYLVGISEWLTAISYLLASFEYYKMIRILEEEIIIIE